MTTQNDSTEPQITSEAGKALIKSLLGDTKTPPQYDRCNKELKWAVSACDTQFNKDGDVVKHRQCLQDARQNFDTCMKPGG